MGSSARPSIGPSSSLRSAFTFALVIQGEIIAVGPGGRDEAGKLIPIDLKVGDRVLFGKWSGTEVIRLQVALPTRALCGVPRTRRTRSQPDRRHRRAFAELP
jgi:hypothetical protein